MPSKVDQPIQQPTDFLSFIMSMMEGAGAFSPGGQSFTQQYRNDTLKQMAKSVAAGSRKNERLIIEALESRGIDTNKAYGSSTEDIREIRSWMEKATRHAPRVDKDGNPIWEGGEGQVGGEGFKGNRHFINNIENIVKETSVIGESPKEWVPEEQEFNKLQIMAGLRNFQRQNPDFDISDLGAEQAAEILDISPDEAEKLVPDIQEVAGSEGFHQFNQYADMAQQQIDLQQSSLEQYAKKQKEVQAPGYAKKFVEETYQPAQVAMNQYYKPSGGSSLSQFAQDVGANEAALGREGSTLVGASALKQRTEAQQKLDAEKAAKIAGMQQYIDFGNPAEALRFGSALGPAAQQTMNTPLNAALAPVQQMFPMASQQYQMSLQPFSMGQAVPQGPGAWDYAAQGINMGIGFIDSIIPG